MILDRPATDRRSGPRPSPGPRLRDSWWWGALGAAARGVLACLAGLVLVAGLALIVWAVTPSSGGAPAATVRAGVAAFAAGHLVPLHMGAAEMTLSPLLLTVLMAVVLGSGAHRGRAGTSSVRAEVAAVLACALGYAAVAIVVIALAAPPGVVAAGDLWRIVAFAVLVCALAMAVRGQAIRTRLRELLPGWAAVGLRAGAAAIFTVICGGALVLAASLVLGFDTALRLADVSGSGAGAALAAFIVNLAFLPNAVLAAVGYSLGAGFTVGAGSYSPLGSHPAPLPGLSLLAGVPEHAAPSRSGLLVLLIPLVAAVLVAWVVRGRCATRRERLQAAGTSALVAGVGTGALVAMAAGGVGGGRWPTSGAPPVATAGLLIAVVVVIAGTALALLDRSSVPWDTGSGLDAEAGADHDRSEPEGAQPDGSDDHGAEPDRLGSGADDGPPTGEETRSGTDADAQEPDAELESDAESEPDDPSESDDEPTAVLDRLPPTSSDATPADPVDGAPSNPADGTPADPVDVTPAEPVDGTPADPVDGTANPTAPVPDAEG